MHLSDKLRHLIEMDVQPHEVDADVLAEVLILYAKRLLEFAEGLLRD